MSPRKLCYYENCHVVNYASEPVNNVANCSHSTSISSSGFVWQPVDFNKSVHKHVSSGVVKNFPSVNASETFCTVDKCKNRFNDLWIQFLVLLSPLNYGYRFM